MSTLLQTQYDHLDAVQTAGLIHLRAASITQVCLQGQIAVALPRRDASEIYGLFQGRGCVSSYQ